MAMKKKYRCTGLGKGNWWVVEEQTGQTIAKGTESEIKRLTANLNSGTGFGGNTPAFLLKDLTLI